MENGNDPSADSEFLATKNDCRFFLQFQSKCFFPGIFPLNQPSFSIQFLLCSAVVAAIR